MLVKLLPEQISRNWKAIRYSIEQALPPISIGAEDRYDRILMKLLNGTMQCWVNYNKEQTQMNAIVTTTFTGDDVLGVKNLLIYSMYGMGFSKKDFGSGMLTLFRFAKANKCNRIVAYSDSDEIISLVNRLKGDTSYTFISLPVE